MHSGAYLGSSCAFHTTESEVIPGTLEILEILYQILDPQACSLSHRGQLCRLKVSVSQAGKVLVLQSKLGQLLDNSSQLREQDIQTISQEDLIH